MRGESVWYHYIIFEGEERRYGDLELRIRPLRGEIVVILRRRYVIDNIVHQQHGRSVALELRPEEAA